MPKPRSKYTDAFKQDAIRLVLETHMPLTEAAAKLGVPNSVLSKWVKQRREEGQSAQDTQDKNNEPNLRQLVKRMERLEGSLEVLRKIVQEDLVGRVKTAFPD